MKEYEFGKYTPIAEDEKAYLKAYDPNHWPKASHTTDIAVFAAGEDALELLLIKRGGVPYRGRYCLPGGFINMDESLYETAARELLEETGIENLPLYQVKTYGELGRDPRDRNITTLYLAFAKKIDIKAKAGDDAADADFAVVADYNKEVILAGDTKEEYISLTLEGKNVFEPKMLKTYDYSSYIKESFKITDTGDLAFDHARAVIEAYEFLKHSFLTGDIARNILGNKFNISSLKKLFKIVFLRPMEEEDAAKMNIEKGPDGLYYFL